VTLVLGRRAPVAQEVTQVAVRSVLDDHVQRTCKSVCTCNAFTAADIYCFLLTFLPVRRYASAATSYVALYPSVCLSQVGVLSKRKEESSWFLSLELPSTHPILREKEIRVPSQIRVLPSGTLSQTPDLENFVSAYRSSKRVINLARRKVDVQSVIDWTVVGQLSR